MIYVGMIIDKSVDGDVRDLNKPECQNSTALLWEHYLTRSYNFRSWPGMKIIGAPLMVT